MLFNREFISKLGTKSLSRDSEKTKERANAAWKGSPKKKHKELMELANVKYPIAYRVRKIGAITTKMTIAYSQVFNLDPYYLIGAVDDDAGYSFEAAKKLLTEIGRGQLVKNFEKTIEASGDENQKSNNIPVQKPPVFQKELSSFEAMQTLSDGEIIALLLGVMAKAKAGKPQAIADMAKITEILLG